jgi:hypothetical protein
VQEDQQLHYDEAVMQMSDPQRHAALMRLTFKDRHPCPVDDCRLSAEEHHRLAYGLLSELRSLRRRVAEFENGERGMRDEG